MVKKLAGEYKYDNEDSFYWTDKRKVFWCGFEVKNADIETFEHYYGCWAKDKNNCYNGNLILKNANCNFFTVLNYGNL